MKKMILRRHRRLLAEATGADILDSPEQEKTDRRRIVNEGGGERVLRCDRRQTPCECKEAATAGRRCHAGRGLRSASFFFFRLRGVQAIPNGARPAASTHTSLTRNRSRGLSDHTTILFCFHSPFAGASRPARFLMEGCLPLSPCRPPASLPAETGRPP